MTNLNPKQFLATSIQNGPSARDVPERQDMGDDEWYHGTRSWGSIKRDGELKPYGSGDFGDGLYLTKDSGWAEDYAWGYRSGDVDEDLGARRLTVKVDLAGANLGDADTDPFAENVDGVRSGDNLLVIRPEAGHRILGVTEARGPDRFTREDIEADGW